MGRQRIKDVRREELIDAAISAVAEHGFAAVTVNQIAARAGASAGSIHYYFGGKEELLEATMRRFLAALKRETLDRLSRAAGHRERLSALILANFSDTLFTGETCNVWMQFWAYAPYSKPLARLQRINRSRVRSNLNAELGRLLPPAQKDTARRALQAYMDGAWLRKAHSPDDSNGETARQEAEQVIKMLIG